MGSSSGPCYSNTRLQRYAVRIGPAATTSALVLMWVQGEWWQGRFYQRIPWRQRAAVQWPDAAFPRRGAQSPGQRPLHWALTPPPCSSMRLFHKCFQSCFVSCYLACCTHACAGI